MMQHLCGILMRQIITKNDASVFALLKLSHRQQLLIQCLARAWWKNIWLNLTCIPVTCHVPLGPVWMSFADNAGHADGTKGSFNLRTTALPSEPQLPFSWQTADGGTAISAENLVQNLIAEHFEEKQWHSSSLFFFKSVINIKNSQHQGLCWVKNIVQNTVWAVLLIGHLLTFLFRKSWKSPLVKTQIALIPLLD